MTRIATPPGFSYPWHVRLVLALRRRKYGAELAPARLRGRMPRTFLRPTPLYRSIDRARSPIEPDEQASVEPRALIAYQNLSSKFNCALTVPAQGLCRRAEEGGHRG